MKMNEWQSIIKSRKYNSVKKFTKNVKEAPVFIILYVIIIVVCLSVIILLLTKGMKPTRREDLSYIDATVESAETIQGKIRLTVKEADFYFVIFGDQKKLLNDDPSFINRLLQTDESFRFGYQMNGPDGKEYGLVQSIFQLDGTEILSLEASNRYGQKNILLCVGLFSVLFVSIIICFIMTIRIGRNPHKYSNRVIKLFFKDGYIY